jgi:hypothetical protein
VLLETDVRRLTYLKAATLAPCVRQPVLADLIVIQLQLAGIAVVGAKMQPLDLELIC